MADKEPSQRQLRVGQEIKKILAELIERGEIRNLLGMDVLVTVMEARVSPDMKYCSIYFITSKKEKHEEVRKALQLAASHLRKVLSSKLTLRYTPELDFRIDGSFEQVDRLEQLLRDPKVAQDLKKD